MKQQYLYVISDGEDTKIGVATDPEKRLKALQTGNKRVLTLEYVEPRNNPFKLEKHLHRYFAKQHIGGEWFTKLNIRDIRVQILLYTDHD